MLLGCLFVSDQINVLSSGSNDFGVFNSKLVQLFAQQTATEHKSSSGNEVPVGRKRKSVKRIEMQRSAECRAGRKKRNAKRETNDATWKKSGEGKVMESMHNATTNVMDGTESSSKQTMLADYSPKLYRTN